MSQLRESARSVTSRNWLKSKAGGERAVVNCDTLSELKALFESLGGLPETTVQNTEWLYMLEEDTRQSLAIEGHFATEEELKAVLRGGKTDLAIANYFHTAETVYDQALQYYRESTVLLGLPVVRHIHSELFRELDDRRGEFRKGGIKIQGAKVQPPEFEVEAYVRAALSITAEVLGTLPILSALARAHALFESIHPFHAGNGRVGRILLNYLAVSRGYPPIVIKGISSEERKRYYTALETSDRGFHNGFPGPTPEALRTRLEEGNYELLGQLFCEGLLPRLDRLIVVALERQEPLLELAEVAARLGVREDALRQRIHRGRLVAIKRGKKLYSHPRLAL
jgi:fido (protein-threonine AMPylation protein)